MACSWSLYQELFPPLYLWGFALRIIETKSYWYKLSIKATLLFTTLHFLLRDGRKLEIEKIRKQYIIQQVEATVD